MTEQTALSGKSPGLIDRVMEWLPARLRRGTAVVPVVRLSGVIGAVTPLRPPRRALSQLAACNASQ